MTDDTFVSQNHSQGEPTLLGANEGTNTVSSIFNFLKGAGETYGTVKNAIEGKGNAPAQVPKQAATGAKEGISTNMLLIVGGVVAVLVVVVVFLRR